MCNFMDESGVDDIDVDMAMQKVTVMGWADQKKVLKVVRKTGRRAELWPYPYNPEYYNFNKQYYDRQQYDQSQSPASSTYYANLSRKSSRKNSKYDEYGYTSTGKISSYNYYHHGYSDDSYGYYQRPLYSTIVDDRAAAMFSDDNPHACSIM